MPQNGPRHRSRDSGLPSGNRLAAGDLNIVNAAGNLIGLSSHVLGASNGVPSVRENVWDETHDGPPYKTGGPFTKIKIVRPQHVLADVGKYDTTETVGSSWHKRYDGGFFDPEWPPILDPVPESEYNSLGTVYSTLYPDLATIGSNAYSRLRPKVDQAGLGVVLAEARDIPSMLRTSAKGFHEAWKVSSGIYTQSRLRAQGALKIMAPKKAADHFINHNFGWAPFIGDMSKLYKTYANTKDLLSQISKDNGKVVRRKRVDTQLRSESIVYTRTDWPGCQPGGYPFNTMFVPGSYLYTITKRDITDVWYEGSFTYYRPEFDSSLANYESSYSEVMRQMSLYGLNMSPTTVWKATPWSWLVDWFSNAGDVLQRAEDWATDQVVSHYMYLMHRKRYEFELRSRFTTTNGFKHDISWFRNVEIKRRQEASSSFGFNLLDNDLSFKQIAILSALGISRW